MMKSADNPVAAKNQDNLRRIMKIQKVLVNNNLEKNNMKKGYGLSGREGFVERTWPVEIKVFFISFCNERLKL